MKQSIKILLIIFLVIFISGCVATNLRKYEEGDGKLLLGATIHLGNGDVIYNSAVGIKGGLITLLVDATDENLNLSKFEVERLGPDFHIYSFKKTQLGNVGIVLVREDDKHINISIRDKELERSIVIGNEAMLLVCKGSIEDAKKFKVEFLYMGDEKIHMLQQSDYVIFKKGKSQ